jgi:non-ribosomal peptide synthetase component F
VTVTLFHRIPVHRQVDDIVGDFTSLVLVEIDYTRREPLLARARRVQERLWQDLDHRMVSGVEVLREIGRARGRLARQSIPVVFTSTLFDDPLRMQSAGVPGTEIVYGVSQTPQVWIDHQVSDDRGGLAFSWDVVEGLIAREVVDEMFAVHDQLLHRLAAPGGAEA